ncbi:MAG: phosphate signaling complex protein PhoU [Parvularculaceae bacterium]|nr:phosphate signaling complex protein PhoU [Parvularculaceae bacterium]
MPLAGQLRNVDTLKGLEIDLAQIAGLVESQLADAIAAFERRDIAAAERIIAADSRIDDQHQAVEAKVMDLLAGGPFPPGVVREIMTHMKVAGELERVGDLAKNVAKRTLVVSRERAPPPYAGVVRMGRASLQRVADILTAYSTRNIAGASAVWGGDDELDELYNSLFKEILLAMMADPSLVNVCTQLVFIAKNFERIGDHATNIAEAVHFLVTGAPPRGERPKNDETSVTVVRTPDLS